jgi:hypothetical protein
MAGWLGQLAVELGEELAARVDRDSHFYPRLVIGLDEPTARRWAAELAARERAIVVPHHPLPRGELVICPEATSEPDRDLVRAGLLDLAPTAIPA